MGKVDSKHWNKKCGFYFCKYCSSWSLTKRGIISHISNNHKDVLKRIKEVV